MGGGGLWLGGAAVLFWGFASALIYFGARELGTWSFLAGASLLGAAVQLAAWRWHQGAWRTALRLPARLWLVPLPCFVAYGLLWPAALAAATPAEVFGVNLINYLWPVLTVLLGAWWVPDARLTRRTVAATALSLVGLAWANLPQLRSLLPSDAGAGARPLHVLPLVLALGAALSWAAYSAVLARWRGWAGGYATSPLGFLLTGVVAAVLGAGGAGEALLPTGTGVLWTVLYGCGPLAAGYLLWEMALARAPVHALSLLAAATPILSTLVLGAFLRTWPGPELLAGAACVSAGALLSARR